MQHGVLIPYLKNLWMMNMRIRISSDGIIFILEFKSVTMRLSDFTTAIYNFESIPGQLPSMQDQLLFVLDLSQLQ